MVKDKDSKLGRILQTMHYLHFVHSIPGHTCTKTLWHTRPYLYQNLMEFLVHVKVCRYAGNIEYRWLEGICSQLALNLQQP